MNWVCNAFLGGQGLPFLFFNTTNNHFQAKWGSFVVCRPTLHLLKTLLPTFHAEAVDLVVWAAACLLTGRGWHHTQIPDRVPPSLRSDAVCSEVLLKTVWVAGKWENSSGSLVSCGLSAQQSPCAGALAAVPASWATRRTPAWPCLFFWQKLVLAE